MILPASVKLEVQGGSGDDSLYGTTLSDELIGGAGADTLWGGGGKDTLRGGSGKDRLSGYGLLEGGSGDDFIELFGLPGQTYRSTVRAGAGADHVLSRNKVRDVIDCGAGKDTATARDTRLDRVKNCRP